MDASQGRQEWVAYDRDGQELGRLALASLDDPADAGRRFTVEMQQRMYRRGDEDAAGIANFTHVIDVYQHGPGQVEEKLHVQINGRPAGTIHYTQEPPAAGPL